MASTLIELDNKRKELYEEISAIQQQLDTMKPDKLDQDLIDAEGFPRADLDYGKLLKWRQLKKDLNGKKLFTRKNERLEANREGDFQ